MNYKKFFPATALVALLSLSNSAFSEPIGDVEEGETSYYVRVQYNGGDFFNVMNGKELKGNTGEKGAMASLYGHKKDGSGHEVGYKPEYKSSWFTGGVAAGYAMEGIRVEGEVFYSNLEVDGSDYKAAGSTTAKPENAKAFGKNTGLTGADAANAVGENKGLSSIVGMVNAYYDVDLGNENIPVVPYVGAGVGLSVVDFLGKKHTKLAYQAKAGVSYAVTPEIKLYGGYRYFGMYSDEFTECVLKYKKGTESEPKEETKANLKQEGFYNTLGIHGVEAGVMFHF